MTRAACASKSDRRQGPRGAQELQAAGEDLRDQALEQRGEVVAPSHVSDLVGEDSPQLLRIETLQ